MRACIPDKLGPSKQRVGDLAVSVSSVCRQRHLAACPQREPCALSPANLSPTPASPYTPPCGYGVQQHGQRGRLFGPVVWGQLFGALPRGAGGQLADRDGGGGARVPPGPQADAVGVVAAAVAVGVQDAGRVVVDVPPAGAVGQVGVAVRLGGGARDGVEHERDAGEEGQDHLA